MKVEKINLKGIKSPLIKCFNIQSPLLSNIGGIVVGGINTLICKMHHNLS